ncbi:MAG: succinate dehydrogenase, hydrophobic membrane anchor protein [Proteobacteria bacterium]|nr:succinate dehydrogenase, hydrophobic membrane anchor protein [Pseudomonadota bacterium]MCH9758415.1 succinate dehydrogenase, hydrophobic membrane anchor protein [Pseudomonadota bacterium]
MAVKKAPVGAHYGLRDWLVQRISALVIVVATLILFIALLVVEPQGFREWHAFVGQIWVRVLLMLTILALVWHAFIGARDIFMDYLKHDLLRLFKIVGVIIYLLICLIWAASILL